ncbi:hypothetical protein [Mesorhizobium carmichaelinearum]|uniref:hypothetical protein n=1 Tax=Mesorhizobium carmichaelinearum TaxID=1208188 RepID=UPI00117E4386|nr:hypothetical protein [Mesorhizobium carmichaelinearum]
MKHAAFILLSLAVLLMPSITAASSHTKKHTHHHRHEKIAKPANRAKPMPLYQQIQHRHYKGKDLCWRMYNGNLIDICVG